jgi:general nucleoside transport system permease protein
VIARTLELAVPFILAGLGGLLSERAGVLNIGLEGLLLAGAFAGLAVAQTTGSLLLGFLGAGAAGLAASVVMAEVTLRLKANLFIAGLALNLLIAGVVPVASRLIFSTAGVVRLESTATLPRVFALNPTVYLALLLTVGLAVWLARTPGGLRLRVAGENPRALRYRGVDPNRVQYAALLGCGVLAALGGAVISLRLGVYLPNISAGRGWIALVTIFLGLHKPSGVAVAGVLFAVFESLAASAQAVVRIPATALLGLPHLITVIAMVIYALVTVGGRRGRRRAAALTAAPPPTGATGEPPSPPAP